MKCLYKYQWVKLQRNYLPEGKGILGYWAKLAACVAYRKGTAFYCGYENAVSPGMWSGGVTGIRVYWVLKAVLWPYRCFKSCLNWITWRIN